MPFFETVPELTDTIADLLGVYGSHNADDCSDDLRKMCRTCFVSVVESRIRAAVETERLLEGVPASPKECRHDLLILPPRHHNPRHCRGHRVRHEWSR